LSQSLAVLASNVFWKTVWFGSQRRGVGADAILTRMSKPFLDLGDVGVMIERIGRRRSPQRMRDKTGRIYLQ
jgi:hypothetical protein